MLTIFRRHGPRCGKKSRTYKRCKCPVWIEGTALGKVLKRQALGTRSWEEAESLKRRLEEGRGEPVTIAQAASDFRLDIDRRKLSPETIRKYKSLLKDLEDFARRTGICRLDSFSVSDARRFVTEWKLGPNTAARQIERLRTFFRFCLETRWIDHNPARDIRPPKVRLSPTLPFSPKEMEKILATCEPRLRALVLLMRYSGLRKQDAACLAKDRLSDSRLMLYTAKTGTPVYLPLPPTVIKALESIPHSSGEYFFWTGEGTPKANAGLWNKRLVTMFRAAGVSNGHAHRFRDTFAVELLLKGVPLERVSILLGHTSVRVTERHYSPWIKARQEQAEHDVMLTWVSDPILREGYNPGTVQ